MLVLGLFQRCESGSSSMCQQTLEWTDERREDFWNYILHRERHNVRNVISIHDFEYRNMTFCTIDEATQLVLDIFLNEIYFVSDSIQINPQWNGLKIQDWQKTSKIVSVLIYADDVEISRLISQLLNGQDFPVTFMSERSTYSVVRGTNVVTAFDYIRRNTDRLLNRLGYGKRLKTVKFIKNIAIIFIQTDYFNYKEEFEDFFTEYKKLGACFFFYKLNITKGKEVDQLLHTLMQNSIIDFRILFGET